jgi:hypothetical protein
MSNKTPKLKNLFNCNKETYIIIPSLFFIQDRYNHKDRNDNWTGTPCPLR